MVILLLVLLGFFSVATAQDVPRGHKPSASPRTRVMTRVAPRDAATINVTGSWHGGLNSPGSGSGADWVEEIQFQQDSSGNITGTRRTIPQQNTAAWDLWSIAGSISGSTVTFQDQTLMGQGDPSITPCPITGTIAVSADASSFSGTFTTSPCNGGPISATKYTVDPTKNLGDGARCDSGEGTPGGGGASGSGGNANAAPGSSCAEKQGAASVGDPINASNGNSYHQEDDYLDGNWLTFRRFYNSSSAVAPASIGIQWRHSFDRTLAIYGNPASTIVMVRPDGRQETFTKSNGAWSTELSVDQLTETDNAQSVATSYNVFIGSNRHTETYDTTGKLLAVTAESGQGITLTYSTATTPTSVAPRAGLLLTVTDPQGRQLNFIYNYYTQRLSQVTLPDGGTLVYSYDTTSSNLVSVQYPDTKTRQYVYNESSLTGGANLPNAMTGIIDEKGARYETTTFDSTGRATSSSFAGGVGTTKVTYNADGTSSVTFPLGYTAKFGLTTADGLARVGTLDQPCGPDCGQPWKSRTYDSNGYPASYTDFNNVTTQVTYDAYGLLHQETDALGTPNQRTTTTTWDTVLRNPLTRTIVDANGILVAQSGWAYNARGQALATCDMDPTVAGAATYTCVATGTAPAGVRRSTATYCDAVDTTQCPWIGLLLSSTGPRTDVTTTTYYSYYLSTDESGCGTVGSACHRVGDLYQITDALGHVATIIAYDKAGRIVRERTLHGVLIDFTYHARGWLLTRTVHGYVDGSNGWADSTTQLAYNADGTINKVTDADGVFVTYTYDPAHRLTDITDAIGNYIHYTLDATGHRITEQTFDAGKTVHRSLTRQYNALGQLISVTDGLSNTVYNAGYSDSYDGNGNLVHNADALGVQQKNSYDALNRLFNTINNYNGTDIPTQNASSTFAYDALNRLEGISDSDGLSTTYDYDGLSNPKALHSPDTGTASSVYDIAGNRTQMTDAKGTLSTYTYDALNRVTSVSYADPTLNVIYHYDELGGCQSNISFQTGHVTSMLENNLTTLFCYDALGNVSHTYVNDALSANDASVMTSSNHTLAGRLLSETSPQRILIVYGRDANGRIVNVTNRPPMGPVTVGNVVQQVTYLPFGPMLSYTLGNGQTITRSYDANYRLTDLTSPALNLHVSRDAMGNIRALGNTPGAQPATETYGYDPLYRLASDNNSAGTAIESYTYSKAGDRLSKTGRGLATGTYGYQSGTHWLTTIGNTARTYDANGNTSANAVAGQTYGFGYDGRNRMSVVQLNGQTVATYRYNALGERISKVATMPQAVTEEFIYDPDGRLIEEYGTTNRDYIWLDNVPVAAIDTTASGVAIATYYVHADELGAPRAVSDASGVTQWQWSYQGNPFGEQPPTSTSGFTFNLRFPGQYYDAESGLIHNGYRGYCAECGRYIQSDPIGLSGGLNTYAYAGNNPLTFTDAMGLAYQMVVGGGATLIVPLTGGGLNFNVGINFDRWNSSIYIQDQGNIGAPDAGGYFASAGINFSLEETDAPTTGFDSQKYFELDAGLLGGLGVYGSPNSCGKIDIGGIKGTKAGFAVGAGGYLGTTYTATAVSPTLRDAVSAIQSIIPDGGI